VKDRPARAIIRAAERQHRLGRGTALLDASSGNTGIAYAMLCAQRGYRCEICLPANASVERRRLLRSYGATVVLTDALQGSDGAIHEARRRAAESPERYFYADQYNNPENVRAHYETTGVEIWEQTEGAVTHFVAGLGTTGTFAGTARRLKEHDASIQTIAVQPESGFHGLEGLKHLPSSIVPGIWDPSLADEVWGAPTEPAYDLARALARTEGLLVGHSCGAALWAIQELAARVRRGVVVTVFPDSGDRYLSTGLYRPRS
jgi:cysteine synthase B